MPPETQRWPEPKARTTANAETDSTTTWYLIKHQPRRLWVGCATCHYSAINELNLLRRAGWQETSDTPRRYRCGDCAELAS